MKDKRVTWQELEVVPPDERYYPENNEDITRTGILIHIAQMTVKTPTVNGEVEIHGPVGVVVDEETSMLRVLELNILRVEQL